jgi:hypothetical protein
MCGRMTTPGTLVSLILFALLSGAPAQAESVHVTGTLTDEGVECRAMRGDDGVLYSLVPKHKLQGLQPGDHIEVEGSISPVSFCMQGTTIAVERIEKTK